MVNKRKSFLSLLVVILLVTTISACGGGSSPAASDTPGTTNSPGETSQATDSVKEPVTIKLLAESAWMVGVTEKLKPELLKKGIKLEADFFDYNTYVGKVKLAMTSQGGDYDVVSLYTGTAQLWANAKADIPLNDYMKKYNYDENDYYESVKNYQKFDGNWYTVPVDAVSMVYMYRKDLYDAAGLQPPKTIDEMYETAKKLTKDNMFGIAYPGGPGEGASSFWSYFLWSYGGKYLDDAGKPLLNSPEAVKSAEMFAKMLNEFAPKGVTTWQNAETVAAFNSGNVAAMIMWPGFYGDITDKTKSKIFDKVGIAPLPAGPSGKAVPRFGASGLGITANSKHKDAAFEVINAFANPEALKIVAQFSTPASKKVNADPALRAQMPTLAASSGALDTAQERPGLPEFDQINNEVGNAINAIVAGKPAKQTLDDIQKKVEGILKK
jgi:multiple sugar transport system substrate-binding protein